MLFAFLEKFSGICGWSLFKFSYALFINFSHFYFNPLFQINYINSYSSNIQIKLNKYILRVIPSHKTKSSVGWNPSLRRAPFVPHVRHMFLHTSAAAATFAAEYSSSTEATINTAFKCPPSSGHQWTVDTKHRQHTKVISSNGLWKFSKKKIKKINDKLISHPGVPPRSPGDIPRVCVCPRARPAREIVKHAISLLLT